MILLLLLFGICFVALGSAFKTASVFEKDNFWLGLIGIILLIGGSLMVGGSVRTLSDQVEKEPQKNYYYEGFKVDIEDIADLNEFTIIYDAEKDTYTLIKKEK